MTYLISRFLPEQAVTTLRKELSECEWYDGLESFEVADKDLDKDAHLVKKNLQADIDDTMMFSAMDLNIDFINFVYPNRTRSPLYTKTPTGGFYKPHFDDVRSGHFSTTVFLSDPDEYDGGELALFLNGKEEKFKLEPGWGITYETGTPHEVKPVTRGDRLASIFWTTSHIWHMPDLHEYRYWTMMARKHKGKFIYDDVEDFHNCMHNHFSLKADRIARKYAFDHSHS